MSSLIYAGIGARKTPLSILVVMKFLAIKLKDQGWKLRTGGADGADEAFANGGTGARSIYIPGSSYNKWTANDPGCFDFTKMPGFSLAMETVDRYHPNPGALSSTARLLMGRNAMILMGPGMDSPADMVVAYTPDGRITGGTGQALRMAADAGIKVFNLGKQEDAAIIYTFLWGLDRNMAEMLHQPVSVIHARRR